MTAELQEKLLSAHLAGADDHNDATWLWMHPALAEIYTALLSFSVAERNSLVATTDDPIAHRAFGDSSFERMLYQLLIAVMESLRSTNYVVITHQPNPCEEAVILQMELPFLLA
jgi:hypothetical protein